MKEKAVNPVLLSYYPIVDCIADILGPNVEVVLHALDDLEQSIVKIRNGTITGRKVGDGMTDVGLEMIKDAKEGLEIRGNYRSCTKNGRFLKCNAATIRDGNKKVLGLLCINIDIGSLLEQSKVINAFCLNDAPNQKRSEKFGNDLNSVLHEIINDVIRTNRTPVHRLTKKERLVILSKLKNRGVFYAKGAMEKVAAALGVSTPCIYNYLREIRTTRDSRPSR